MNNKLEQLLEAPTRESYAPIADLYNWSMNYDYPTPMSLFADLIGYSEDRLGMSLCGEKMPLLGYLEMDMLADALKVIADNGEQAREYAYAIIDAESAEDEEEVSA